MAELRALVTLAVLLFTQIHSQKILSDRKKCGDPQCESMMMRVSAKQDYSGPDCRFLTFKPGDEINVYYKLTGRREDLWQGSKGKAYGFFPKDTVIIEEVFLSEEIEIPAQEIDFVCLDGGEYFFENEDSVLNNIKKKKPSDHILPEDTSTGGGHLPEESPDVTVQETPDPEAPDKESWGPSGIAGWFGLGKTNEKKETETDAENINKETVNEEAESEKQPGKSPPEKSGWLGGRLKKFLPFGEQRDEPQSMDNEANGEKASTPTQQTDQDQRNLNKDGEDSKSKWFNFGIKDVLGFGVKNEKKEETIENVDEIDNEMTPENPSPSQDRPVDSNPVPDQSDISGTEKVDKTKDIDVEDTTVTNAPEKEELSPHCDAEEAGTGGRCAITKSPHRPWKRPQESEENPRANVPIQPNPGGLPFTVMLRKISSRYTEVYSNYLTAVRSLVTRTISKRPRWLLSGWRSGGRNNTRMWEDKEWGTLAVNRSC